MRAFWVALLTLTACGSSSGGGNDGGAGGSTVLEPGSAGAGHLAYLVETPSGRELEIVNLSTAKVEFRSDEAAGEVGQFLLSDDGSTAVFRTGTRPCTRVALPAGTTTDCAPAGLMLAFFSGLSGDGKRVAFTALTADTFKPTLVIVENGANTVLAAPPDDGQTQVTGGGALSPDGEFAYEFRFPSNSGQNPPLTLLKYPRSGAAPTVVFDGSADVRGHGITDLVLQLSEDGTRGLFSCFDPTQAVAAEGISTCTVELATGAVTRLPNAVGALALDGRTLVTVPPFGEGYRVYAFGSTTPTTTITRPGGAVALSVDGSRLAYRMKEDDAFYVAATVPVSGGTPVRVQRDDAASRAVPEKLIWKR